MKTKTILLGFALSIITQISNAQNFEWAKKIGGTGYDEGTSVATDSFGNVYATGFFEGTVDFDPGSGVFNLTSAGNKDIFISKFNSSGDFEWAKRIGGTGKDSGQGITIDTKGNILTTGYFRNTVDFDPNSGTVNLSSSGNEDIFILKLDSAGNFVWAKRMGAGDWDYGYAVTTDASGNIYTTGSFSKTVDFDPSSATVNLTAVGSSDIFISKFDASGNFIWAKKIGGMLIDEGTSVSVDDLGNVYTTGYFNGNVDFDPNSGTYNLNTIGDYDIFISKLDASGNFVWAKQFGSTFADHGRSITVDKSGNVYATGNFKGTVDFDPNTSSFNLTSAGLDDIFILKLDKSGNFVWAKQLGGTSSDFGQSITLDSSGNIYTTGSYVGTVDFDPGVNNYNLTSALSDIFISKLDASGNFSLALSLGGSLNDGGKSISLDNSGNIFTTGYFKSTADFDPSSNTFNLTATRNDDIFVHKLSQPTLSINDNNFKNQFSVYPNPTKGQLSIALENSSSKIEITLRNNLGQEIFRKSYFSTNFIELTFDGEDGIYFLEIKENDMTSVVKIVKH